jgi:hypothetical protein
MEKQLEGDLREGYIIMATEDTETAETNLEAGVEALTWRHADKEK